VKRGRIVTVVLAAIVCCGGAFLLQRYHPTPTMTHPTKPTAHRSAFGRLPKDMNGETANALTNTDELTREEINAYLQENNCSPTSLLAANVLLHDINFLKEAATRYPNVPCVQLAVLEAHLFPDDRPSWLTAFQRSAPDNPLPNYLTAIDHFKDGERDRAIAALTQGRGKTTLDTYWSELANAVAEAYASAGFSPADANFMGNGAVAISPITSELQDLCRSIQNEVLDREQTGDSAGANSLATLGLQIGDQLTSGHGGKLLSYELAGYQIQQNFFYHLDPSTTIALDGTTQTPEERLAALRARKDYIENLVETAPLDEWIISNALSDDEVREVSERVRTEGEIAAIEWLRDKLGPNRLSQLSGSEQK
jgi:hypothetical protein